VIQQDELQLASFWCSHVFEKRRYLGRRDEQSGLQGSDHQIGSPAFVERRKTVNALEKETLRNTSADEKLNQLVMLMTSASELGWNKKLRREDKKVRVRWNKLRKVYHVLGGGPPLSACGFT
jgi:hypothetical protein